MPPKTFHISGQVINHQTRRGIANLRVETWDKGLIFDDLVGSAITDEQGQFQVDFTLSYFKEHFLYRQPDLFFKVFHEDKVIKNTRNTRVWNREIADKPIIIDVDIANNNTKPMSIFLDTNYTVLCRTVDSRGQPIAGLRIKAVAQHLNSPNNLLGEPATTDKDGRVVFHFKQSDFTEYLGEQGPDLYFEIYRDEIALSYTLPNIFNDNGVVQNFQPQREPIVLRVDKHWVVKGKVVQENGLPAKELTLFVYHLAFGGQAVLLGSLTTNAQGQYALAYDPNVGTVNLDIRRQEPQDSQQKVSLGKSRFAAMPLEVLNLVVPATPTKSEYYRLSIALKPHIGQMTQLAEAQENAEFQDLTILNRVTGWDARLIALAAIAAQLGADPEVKLPQEELYGLLRAGLPSDKQLLAQVEPDEMEQRLKKVCDAGIVELNDQQIEQFKTQFITFARQTRLNGFTPGSSTTYRALLNTAGLSQEVQDKFISVYFNHRGDAISLWTAARQAGLSDEHISILQLQGKLAFLAGNSEKMTAYLMKKSLHDPVQLVAQDFYRADIWMAELFERADISIDRRSQLNPEDQKILDKWIPTRYVADRFEDRLTAYAEDMARKLRLSYPTQVLGRLLETDDQFKLATAHDNTVILLKAATEKGFRLGKTPVTAFFAQVEMAVDMSVEEIQVAQQQMQMLQRVYQITPTHEALSVLMALNLTSAYDIVEYSEAEFKHCFEAKYLQKYSTLPVERIANLIYSKAKQISSITYSVFTMAKNLSSGIEIASISGSATLREAARDTLLNHYPTMESLFGSMDFCECEHCRSVLSPAAYLVDLLQFIDYESGIWANFLKTWKETHNNQEYPYENSGKPYDVLIERRPDLPYISLTCENTHTPLPYIDIVNEILEYHVAHEKLEKEAAHDTGSATTAELLAEPQNVICEAYDKLYKARYPLNLPFDLWIETVRQFCNYFETPLTTILETFCTGDLLFSPKPLFDYQMIFMESLGLSPTEVAIFTESDPLAKWYELYGFDTPAAATTEAIDNETHQRIDLNSAKALSRRLGLSYKELTEIIQTEFVNPKLTQLHLLYKLGVRIHDVHFYLNHKDVAVLTTPEKQLVDAFEQRLELFAETFQTDIMQLKAELEAIQFDQILVLADPDSGCNFDLTTLQYADGSKAKPIDFLRINFLVHLWRKLGWRIEEIDRALSTFIPLSGNPELAEQLKTALIYLAHLKTLSEKLKIGNQSRLKLLTLWSDIATTGENSLYAQFFLTAWMLRRDPVFDHPLGQYLADPSIKLKDHMLALQSALSLTANEITDILADSKMSLETAELSLPNISILHRYGLLAKALKLSVRELNLLKQLADLDPFKPLHPLTTIEEDYPFSQTLSFVEVVEKIKESGLKIEDIDYLLCHRFDETGQYRPNRESMLILLKTLADGIRAIHAEHAVLAESDVLREVLPKKLGLILPPDTVETFLAMVDGTIEFTATRTQVVPENQLDSKLFEHEPTIRQVSYNEIRQEQKLTFRGVLLEPQKTELPAKFSTVPIVFLELLEDIQKQAQDFFDNHLKKQKLRIEDEAGFLEANDFEKLFSPLMPLEKILSSDTETEINNKLENNRLIEEQNQETLQQRYNTIGQAFLPYLQQHLIRQFVLQTLTAHTAADPVLVASLTTDERLLKAANSKPLLALFEPISEPGIDADFFTSDDLSGVPQPVTMNSIVTPQDVKSARFRGYLEVPTPGTYRFYLEGQAEAKLGFEHLPELLLDTTKTVISESVELQSGIPYQFSLELTNLNSSSVQLLVQGETLPKGPLSQLMLYPQHAITEAEHAVLLLTKTLQIAQSLTLSEREMRYILVHASDFGNIDLNELPTIENNIDATTRFTHLLRLLAYARLKQDLAANTSDLIDIFEVSGDLSKVYPLIAKLTRRDETTVRTTAEALWATPIFNNEFYLQKLWEALQLVERFGVTADSLLEWTAIVSTLATPEQRFNIARNFKEALKARFEPETWQRIAQPIFDKLRQRQRDALVSYVLHQKHFERIEQLYEYFLIDPGMEPVVQTSRIRLAIASVQLFIQRCLLNLEANVHPSAILHPEHWEWMKRYRVWEANRKIFLFPENWLEPEFRDDKTHLFTELEGALLQGDVSSDLVEDAFLNYLKKLDELARLDIVAMHIENSPDPAQRVLHVFGRTYGQAFQYFYRRYDQEWTPWEPVGVEISSDHLAPVVWRDRLYLFWVTFMDKPDLNAILKEDPETNNGNLATILSNTDKPNLNAILKKEDLETNNGNLATVLSKTINNAKSVGKNKQIDVQLHWSEYVEGKWTNQQASQFFQVEIIPALSITIFAKANQSPRGTENKQTNRLTVPIDFNPIQVSIHVSKEPDEDGQERGVFIHLKGTNEFKHSFYLAGRNSSVERGYYEKEPVNPYITTTKNATRYTGSDGLTVKFKEDIITKAGVSTGEDKFMNILQQGKEYTLLPCNNNLTGLGVSKEAFQDAANPSAMKMAIEAGLEEIASLIKPIFYQDNQHTFFIEPNVQEKTIEDWEDSVLCTQKMCAVIPKIPGIEEFVVAPNFGPEDIDPVNPIINPVDWLVNPITVLTFGDRLIGATGQTGLQVFSDLTADTREKIMVNVSSGSGLKLGSKVVLTDTALLEQSGLIQTHGGLNVIGASGLNTALQQNLNYAEPVAALNK
jgi:hypothetical protein